MMSKTKVYFTMNTRRMVNTIKSLLLLNEKQEFKMETVTKEFIIVSGTNYKEVQKEIFDWLKIRVK